MSDMVNSPSHYQLDGFEAIDIIKAALTPEEYRGYLKGEHAEIYPAGTL